MASRMKVQKAEAQLLTPLHLINKGVSGFFQSLFFRVTQVDEIAVMGKDVPRIISFAFTA
jgi:hypothetical protein